MTRSRTVRMAAFLLLSTGLSAAFAQKQATISVWVLTDSAPLFRELASDFEKLNPNTKVTVREYANEAYKTAIQVALASNQPPDVFHNDPGEASFKFVRDDLVMDLTQTAKSANWAKTLSRGTLGAFTLNGKIWGVPYTQQSKFMFYSKDIFAQQKLQPPATFQALLSTCKTLKARGITPISFGNSERWPGIHYLTILNQKVVGDAQIALDYSLKPDAAHLFTDPAYAAALQRLKDMQDAGCFNAAVNSVSPEIAQASFYTGTSAMNFCGTWCLGVMDSNGFKGKYGTFRFPKIEGGKGNQDVVISGPTGLQISAASTNQAAAAAFVSFVVSTPSQAKMLNETQRIPVNPAAITGLKLDPALGGVIQDLNRASGATLWLDSAVESSVSNSYQNVIQEVLNGTKTPAQAMAEVRATALKAKQTLGR